MTSSSDSDQDHTSITARLGIIPGVGLQGTGWMPAEEDLNPWLQIQMEAIYTIRGIATQGCGDQFAWIRAYCVAFRDEWGALQFLGGSSLNDCKVSSLCD